MACRKFMNSYRGNVTARQYNMTRTKEFHDMQARSLGLEHDSMLEDYKEEWVEVESTRIPKEGEAATVIQLPSISGTEMKQRPVGLFNVEGELYAMDSRCPHMGGPLEKGAQVGSIVHCPWHRWCVDVRTGQIGHIGDMEDIAQPTYEVKKADGKVLVCTKPKRSIKGRQNQ